jgi:hypothetical protein
MDLSEILKQENSLLLVKTEDLKIFAEVLVQGILADHLAFPPPREEEKPLTQQEAIEFLHKSRQTFYSWRKKGIITSYKLSGRIYYKKVELISALEKLG